MSEDDPLGCTAVPAPISGHRDPDIRKGETPPHAGEMPPWAAHFLAALDKRGSVACAAKSAGVTRAQVYRDRDANPFLRAAWDAVLESWTDRIEANLFELAANGVREPIVGKGGEVIGERVTHYPRSIEFALKSRRRDTYQDRQTVEHTTEGGAGLQVVLQHREPPPSEEGAG